MFLLVPAYPGCPGQTAVKWLLLLLLQDYLKFIVISTCDSRLKRAEICPSNITSEFSNTISDNITILQVDPT